jgi:hypothetical protein
VRLGRCLYVLRERTKGEDEVVMKVVWLSALRGYSMHVDSDQRRRHIGLRQFHRSLLDYLAAGGEVDAAVPGLDVATGEQPAVEAPVMDEQQALSRRIDNEPRAGDMARSEVLPREWRRRALEQKEHEFGALERGAVRRIAERTDE